MSLFPCSACAAKDLELSRAIASKDAEIARLWKMNQELLDRYTAREGTLPQVVEAREAESVDAAPRVLDPEREERESVDWQESEIARMELDVKTRGGIVQPDFPR